MKSTSDIIEQLKASGDKKVIIAVTDIDGILRGKLISLKKFRKSVDTNTGFCNVIFGWDSNDAVYDNSEVTGWHTGFPDSPVTLDLSTFRKIPWNQQLPFILGDFSNAEDVGGVCPRSLLKNIKSKCTKMGFNPMFSNEYEWFNFDETPQSLKEKEYQKPTPLTPGMFGYSIQAS
jgi:glutamine synthetase